MLRRLFAVGDPQRQLDQPRHDAVAIEQHPAGPGAAALLCAKRIRADHHDLQGQECDRTENLRRDDRQELRLRIDGPICEFTELEVQSETVCVQK